jgi:hypothetical protein
LTDPLHTIKRWFNQKVGEEERYVDNDKDDDDDDDDSDVGNIGWWATLIVNNRLCRTLPLSKVQCCGVLDGWVFEIRP